MIRLLTHTRTMPMTTLSKPLYQDQRRRYLGPKVRCDQTVSSMSLKTNRQIRDRTGESMTRHLSMKTIWCQTLHLKPRLLRETRTKEHEKTSQYIRTKEHENAPPLCQSGGAKSQSFINKTIWNLD
jgi:hypothetical protein